MNKPNVAITILFGLGLLLLGCSNQATPELPPAEAFDQMPLALARPHFQAGYELAGYYELDANDDGFLEVLAVFTLNIPLEQSFVGDTYVMLFDQDAGSWSLTHNWRLDGVNGSAELRDLNDDGFPELLISTEEADSQLGDFVVPYHYADHLFVFTYEPNLSLIELGSFTSTMSDATSPRTTVGEWRGQPAIQTTRDLPPTKSPWAQPYRLETFVWDEQGFASVQVQEKQRVSPIVFWSVRRNAPWAAAALALGGGLSLVAIAIARRSRLRERWFILGIVLLLVAGGIGLGLTQEWLCTPALVLIGLAGLGIGRRVAARLVAEPDRDTEIESAE